MEPNVTICFDEIFFCENSFLYFLVFGNIKKNKPKENYFWSMKIFIKNMISFLEIVFR